MGKPAAKKGDMIVSPNDMHLVQVSNTPPVIVPLPHPFKAKLADGLSKNVNVMGKPAAVKGSSGKNSPKHVAAGLKFVKEPTNKGTVFMGSITVMINGKQAARAGDMAMTCNDPIDLPVGKIVASGTVSIG